MSELPEWALKHLPVKHPEAAMLLGVSERKLWSIVRDHPHYERRGRSNTYYPEHIEALRKIVGQEAEREVPTEQVGLPVVQDQGRASRVASLIEARRRRQ